MKYALATLAAASLLLGASAVMAADPPGTVQPAPANPQGGVPTSPGVVGGVPAEPPENPGMLPGRPGPYAPEGTSGMSTTSPNMPAPKTGPLRGPSG
jgi:hypothetical protein